MHKPPPNGYDCPPHLKTESYLNMLKLLRTLNERIKQIDIYDINEGNLRNDPYSLCFAWLLEVVGFGLLAIIPINIFAGWQGWKNIGWIFSIGIIRWLWLNTIYRTFKAGKGEA